MTLSRKVLKRANSPLKSPKLANTSLRKKALIKKLGHDIQFGAASKANLKVVVRVRPENQREIDGNSRSVIDVVDDHMLIFDPNHSDDDFFFHGAKQKFRDLNKKHHKEQKFMFEKVFGPESNNEDIFETTTKDIIDTLLNGYNCSAIGNGCHILPIDYLDSYSFGAIQDNSWWENKGKIVSVRSSVLYTVKRFRRLRTIFRVKGLIGSIHPVSRVTPLDKKCKDYILSVFAYGATGAGKTFTMIGNKDNPGITFLTVMELYNQIDGLHENKHCELGVSYLEVYNEMVYDLLAPGKPLNLHESGQHVQVRGLSLHKPVDSQDLLRILAEGNTNRSQHPTDANAESSRSHAVFQVFVKQFDKTPGVASRVSIAKLSMIDLAGSERGVSTGYKGVRFREGANINKSLLALGNCINALADGKRHIPYRDSKLTRLLKDSLGGNCRSVMIAAVSRSSMSFEDTCNTLKYANRAKTIKTMLKKNEVNVDQHVSQYVKIVEDLQTEIASLKDKIKEMEENRTVTTTVDELDRENYESKDKDNEPSDEEKALLNNLHDLHCQLKGYLRELLQLESSERELEFKIYNHRLELARMKILSFASLKLDKGILKNERSIGILSANFKHIQHRKSLLQANLSLTKKRIQELSETLKNGFGDNKTLKNTEFELEQNDLKQTIRDMHQSNEYLKELVKKLLSNQTNSEKLTLSLLVAVKQFYLKLKIEKQNDHSVEEMFNNILSLVNVNRLEWADLKDTDNSFGEEILAKFISSEPPILDFNYLINIPVSCAFNVSPVVISPEKLYRRSIMKQSQSQPKVCNIIEQKLLSPLAESLTFMECDSANQENQTVSEPCPSATSDNLESYTEHCLSETKSPEVLSDASVNELKSIKRSNLSKLHSSNHEIGLTGIELLDESLLNKSLNATFEVSPKSKKPVAKVSPTTSFSSQTSPMTIEADINVLSTNVLNDTVTIPSESVDGILLDKNHINEEMNVLCESYHSSQSSINSDKPIPFVVVSSSVEHVNSTFCVEDSTAPLDEVESIKTNIPEVVVACALQDCPQNSSSSMTSMLPPNTKVGITNSARKSFKSSKVSYSRLPPNVLKSTEKSLKRSCSVPNVQGSFVKSRSLSTSKGLNKISPKNSIQRSTSFLKPRPGSSFTPSYRNQENVPPKITPGYGDSVGNQVSKRVLGFFSSKPKNENNSLQSHEKRPMASSNPETATKKQ